MSHSLLPSPKPLASSNAARRRWYRFYAMFSETFAHGVIADAKLAEGAAVLDPWLGVGTTVEAAAAGGFKGIGVDINPVMTVVARGRCLDQVAASESVATVHEREERRTHHAELSSDDPLHGWFAPDTAMAIRNWERVIRMVYPEDQFPERSGFLFTALFEAVWGLAAVNRSKNPTWIKMPSADQLANVSRQQIAEMVVGVAYQKIKLCPKLPYSTQPEVRVGSSVQLDLSDACADLVLTSPPYCTRIDYAVTTRVELAILGQNQPQMDVLRDKTMGTSTVRQVPITPGQNWGNSCLTFLDEVRKHPSKASSTYYYKNYLQYFDDLSRSLIEINRCTKPGGQVVVVVQDSYYKGILVDLPTIVEQMGIALGWSIRHRQKDVVSRTMRRVNSRSRFYRPDVACVEQVLWFVTAQP